jgi:hypothetical protein
MRPGRMVSSRPSRKAISVKVSDLFNDELVKHHPLSWGGHVCSAYWSGLHVESVLEKGLNAAYTLYSSQTQAIVMHLRNFLILFSLLCAAALALPRPALAMDDDAQKALIAAAAIAGVAALVHHNKNHDDGKHKNEADYEAEYERGYRDGLYSAAFNNYNRSDAYSSGFDAGLHERNVRVKHNQSNNWEADRHDSPNEAQVGCIREASSRWGINRYDITPTSSRKTDKRTYEVIISAGYHRATCGANAKGVVKYFDDQEVDTNWGHNGSHGRNRHAYSTDEFSATTELPCSWGRPSHNKRCSAGISRGDPGSASIRVRTPHGGERTLNFDRNNVSTPDGGRLTWGQTDGDWYIGIDDREFYLVPEAAVYGG